MSENLEKYEKINHIIGRFSLITGFCLTFIPLLILALRFGISPELNSLIEGIFSISVLMAPVSLVEVITYTAMLGSGGMYMAYLSGNITNLKIPSAIMALEICDTKAGSEEGEVLSTIAIAWSVITSEIIIIIGVLLIGPLSAKLSHPAIRPAFEHILPALFGAIGVFYIAKEWKIAVAPILLAVILNLAGDLPTALTIPACVLVSILVTRFSYKKGLLSKEKKEIVK